MIIDNSLDVTVTVKLLILITDNNLNVAVLIKLLISLHDQGWRGEGRRHACLYLQTYICICSHLVQDSFIRVFLSNVLHFRQERLVRVICDEFMMQVADCRCLVQDLNCVCLH